MQNRPLNWRWICMECFPINKYVIICSAILPFIVACRCLLWFSRRESGDQATKGQVEVISFVMEQRCHCEICCNPLFLQVRVPLCGFLMIESCAAHDSILWSASTVMRHAIRVPDWRTWLLRKAPKAARNRRGVGDVCCGSHWIETPRPNVLGPPSSFDLIVGYTYLCTLSRFTMADGFGKFKVLCRTVPSYPQCNLFFRQVCSLYFWSNTELIPVTLVACFRCTTIPGGSRLSHSRCRH